MYGAASQPVDTEAACVKTPACIKITSPESVYSETVSVFPSGLFQTVHLVPAKVMSNTILFAIHRLAK